MTATVMLSGPLASNLSLYVLLIFLVPIGLLLAPQPIRKDKRTIAVLVVLLALVIGGPVYAVICNICSICNTCAWWWCPLDCWFI